MHRIIRYSLAKFADCLDQEKKNILAFTIRTTDGEDEAYASKRAEAKGSSMTEELIRFSLVSYETAEGKQDIKHPFEAFDKWSTKARNLVVAAWKKLATPDEREIADFFASATDVE
jgi:Tfp pilus assembly protein PilW